ncbi:ATP synthase subunit c [Sphingorhabdus sp. 109]|jgi:F-type H+-transporting ATPase subunit c|nr:ATP synthase subunit c [Sphingorhabdus sp. 109]
MDLASAQVIGAGIAAIGIGVAASGVGNVFASFLEGALRNPSAADGQQGRLFIGFAAAELLGLIAFAVAMMILYAPPAATPAEAVVVEAAAVEAPVAEEAPAAELAE